MLKELLDRPAASGKKRRGNGILIPRINEYLLTRGKDRPLDFTAMDLRPMPPRTDMRFHPSDLRGEFCPRQWVIKNHVVREILEAEYEAEAEHEEVEYEEEREEGLVIPGLSEALIKEHMQKLRSVFTPRFESRILRIFDTGDFFHLMAHTWLHEMGILYGRWECIICGASKWDLAPTKCWKRRCGGPVVYQEIPIDHKKTQLLGHTDGEVIIDSGSGLERWEIEVKSSNAWIYDTISKEPISDHVDQAACYLFVRRSRHGVMKHLGEPESEITALRPKGVIILYMNKDTTVLREHVIRLTGEIKERLREKFGKIREARRYVSGNINTLPKRICQNAAEGQHLKCPCIGACMDLLPPALPKRKKKAKR